MVRKSITILFLVILVILTSLTCSSAIEQEEQKFEWRMASTWTSSYTPVEGDKFWCDQIDKMSGGRFKITHYPAGSLMGAFEVFDATSMGTIECAGEFPGYWVGKNTAFDLLASVPTYFTWPDWVLWYFEGGGKELYAEIFDKFNLVYYPLTCWSIEQGLQSKKPINTLEDLKGMKVRVGTLVLSDLVSAVGGEAIQLPGGDVYEAMMRGTIDAFEVGTIYNNYNMGLHEVAPYTTVPAWWQPMTICGVVINKDEWEKLPEDLKAIAENAAYSTLNVKTAWLDFKEVEGLKLIQDYGTKIIYFPVDQMYEIQVIVAKIMEKYAAQNPDYAKVVKSQMDFLKSYEAMRKISTPYGLGWGQNPFVYPEVNN